MKDLFFYLASATAAGFDFCLTVWQFGSLGVSNEFKEEEGEAGIEQASLGSYLFCRFTAVCHYCHYCHFHCYCWHAYIHVYNLLILFSAVNY